MAQWPTIPLPQVPDSGDDWPARAEVGPLTRIGPTGENQQPNALDVRTETLRLLLNQIVDMTNRIRDFFLDRDGTVGSAAQPGVWMRSDFDMGGFRIVRTAVGITTTDAVTHDQLQSIQFEGEDELEQILDTAVFKLDGSAVGEAPLNAGNFRVTNVSAGIVSTDAVRRDLVDAAVIQLSTDFLPRNGALAMNANLSFDGALITDPGFIPNNMGDPTALADMVTKRYLDAQIATFGGQDVPVGTVLAFSGAVPPNFLLCDGREVSRFVYQNLFNIVGIAYGSPSSSSVFKLPDLRGRVIVGKDNMGGVIASRLTNANARQLGGKLGTELHTLTLAQLPSHVHSYDDALFTIGTFGAAVGADDGTDADNLYFDQVRTSGAQGGGAGHNNLQPSRVQQFIVRY